MSETLTIQIVEDRLIEAALVESRLPFEHLGPGAVKSSSINFMTIDNQFDINSQLIDNETKRIEYLAKKWGNIKPSPPADAIQRYEEMIFLIARFLPKSTQPILSSCLWAWARAMIGLQPSFRKWCRRNGIKPTTGWRYKQKAIQFLVERFQNEFILFDKSRLHEVEQISDKLTEDMVKCHISHVPPEVKFDWYTPPLPQKISEMSKQLDEAAISRIERGIKKHNAKMRKLKRRKKKAKEGNANRKIHR
jgi:hypothetical protein